MKAPILLRPLKSLVARRPVHAALLVAVVAFYWRFYASPGNGPGRETGRPVLTFPLAVVKGEPGFVGDLKPSMDYRMAWLQSASADGRWLEIAVEDDWLHKLWYFDLPQRRFVARLNTYLSGGKWQRQGVGPWTPGALPLFFMRSHDSSHNELATGLERLARGCDWDGFYYDVDFEHRRLRPLLPRQPERWQKGTIGPETPNRARSRVLVWCDTGRDDGRGRRTFHVRDLETGRRANYTHADFGLPRGARVETWGWLPDDRTLALQEMRTWQVAPDLTAEIAANLFLLDAGGKQAGKPRKIALSDRFENLRKRRAPAVGEDELIYLEVLSIAGADGRLRLAATFRDSQAPNNPARDRSSIWNLDTKSGRLARVMNLAHGISRGGAIVASPAGDLFVTVPASAPAAGRQGTPDVAAVLHAAGQPPMELPFQVPAGWGREGLRQTAVFTGDFTLVYTKPPCELWTIDLRSGKSELLWRPRVGGGG